MLSCPYLKRPADGYLYYTKNFPLFQLTKRLLFAIFKVLSSRHFMKFFTKIIISILSNALAIFVAAKFVSGINIEMTVSNLLVAGALLGFVNTFVRPVIKLLSFPVILLTLGIFTVIINIAMLFLVSYLLPSFSIESLGAAFWGIVIISLVNYFVSAIIND